MEWFGWGFVVLKVGCGRIPNGRRLGKNAGAIAGEREEVGGSGIVVCSGAKKGRGAVGKDGEWEGARLG